MRGEKAGDKPPQLGVAQHSQGSRGTLASRSSRQVAQDDGSIECRWGGVGRLKGAFPVPCAQGCPSPEMAHGPLQGPRQEVPGAPYPPEGKGSTRKKPRGSLVLTPLTLRPVQDSGQRFLGDTFWGSCVYSKKRWCQRPVVPPCMHLSGALAAPWSHSHGRVRPSWPGCQPPHPRAWHPNAGRQHLTSGQAEQARGRRTCGRHLQDSRMAGLGRGSGGWSGWGESLTATPESCPGPRSPALRWGC